MKFNKFEYERPSIKDFYNDFDLKLKRFSGAKSAEEQIDAFNAISDLRCEFDSMHNICVIRHTIDTNDKYYEEENSFFDQQLPIFNDLTTRFYAALVDSEFRNQLEEKFGKQLFVIAELSLKTFKPELLENLREENQLKSEYVKRTAAAKIMFEGKEFNLSSIHPYEISKVRLTRKNAAEAKWGFYQQNAAPIEGIFENMVKVRHSMARKLGYRNFIEMGYARMLRSDYTPGMVAKFREQVREHIVPIATKLRKRQAERLDLPALKYYDEDLLFKNGNPEPQGSTEWILNNARTMYAELSEETNQFFEFMIDNNLLDLVAKNGKAPGGYCSFIGKYKAPFIFSNFNGTSGDIDVLTHEAGHAFQVYCSRDIGINEYNWPTFEACEIHAMSMEYFTWPWMHLFFGDEAEKYQFGHLNSSLFFLPYGVAVDEFQHFVYENPHASNEERNAAWSEIEKKYLPHRDYGDNEFLAKGGFWQRQRHIFEMPFYYIDYTLALICALQFWKKDMENHESAWNDYLRLCKVGGSESFLDLVEKANLISPFEDGCISSVVGHITAWLDKVDDSNF
ncbi:MAG: M3 family oligoendopeptidase [Bacteroidota bacterium]